MTDLETVVSEAIAQFNGANDAVELERVKARGSMTSPGMRLMQRTWPTRR